MFTILTLLACGPSEPEDFEIGGHLIDELAQRSEEENVEVEPTGRWMRPDSIQIHAHVVDFSYESCPEGLDAYVDRWLHLEKEAPAMGGGTYKRFADADIRLVPESSVHYRAWLYLNQEGTDACSLQLKAQ